MPSLTSAAIVPIGADISGLKQGLQQAKSEVQNFSHGGVGASTPSGRFAAAPAGNGGTLRGQGFSAASQSATGEIARGAIGQYGGALSGFAGVSTLGGAALATAGAGIGMLSSAVQHARDTRTSVERRRQRSRLFANGCRSPLGGAGAKGLEPQPGAFSRHYLWCQSRRAAVAESFVVSRCRFSRQQRTADEAGRLETQRHGSGRQRHGREVVRTQRRADCEVHQQRRQRLGRLTGGEAEGLSRLAPVLPSNLYDTAKDFYSKAIYNHFASDETKRRDSQTALQKEQAENISRQRQADVAKFPGGSFAGREIRQRGKTDSIGEIAAATSPMNKPAATLPL